MLNFVVHLITEEAIDEVVVLVVVRLGFVVVLIEEAIEEVGDLVDVLVDVLVISDAERAISDAEETFGGNSDNFSFY